MAFLVAHFRKLKTGSDMANVAIHNSREKIIDENRGLKTPPPDWMKNPDNISLNEGQTGKQAEAAGKRWERVVSEAGLKRKPQQNAARGIEAVFTASAGTFQKKAEWKTFLNDCREWAEKKFGKENVLQWNTHYDETTPHLHMVLVPIIRDPEKGNKYSSGHFLGGPDGLREIQSEIHEAVGKKYGLDRGQEGSEKKHTDQSEWKSELVRKEKEIENRISQANQFVEEKMSMLEENKKKLEAREWAVNAAYNNLEQAGKVAAGITEHIHKITPQEKKKFWPLFRKKIPEFIKGIVQEVKAEIKAERPAKTPDDDFGPGYKR